MTIKIIFGFLLVVNITKELHTLLEGDVLMCIKPNTPQTNLCLPKRRRYDITDYGDDQFYHSWIDVQGQGASNDYCRIVGVRPHLWLSCALAGTHGDSDKNYNSAKTNFDIGLKNSWYMSDEDRDGKADYCRCIGTTDKGFQVVCTKAGKRGFYGSKEEGGDTNTFTITGTSNCNQYEVRAEYGRQYAIPIYP